MTQLNEREKELVALLSEECSTPAEITSKLKNLFAGALEKMLEGEMEEHLGYEKNSVLGNNSGNSRNGYGKKNAVEGFHRMLRKYTKIKTVYPTDEAVKKSVYLSIREISKKWSTPIRDWGIIISDALQNLIFSPRKNVRKPSKQAGFLLKKK